MALKQTETYNRLRSISYTDLSARINRLLTCDCSRLTHDQIESRVRRIADGYATKTAIVDSNGVFRARVNEGRDLFSSASELWYPPAAVVREGRFNRALSPRFYASNIPHAAVLETRPEVGDFVTVLYAATHCDTIWHLTHIGLQHLREGHKATNLTSLRENEEFLGALQRTGVHRKWLKIDDALCAFASRPATPETAADLYKVTCGIASLLEDVPSDGILYPSIEAGARSLNLCIRPETADRTLFPGKAWLLEVVDWRSKIDGSPESDAGYYQVAIRAETGPIPLSGKLRWVESMEGVSPAVIEAALGNVGRLRQTRNAEELSVATTIS